MPRNSFYKRQQQNKIILVKNVTLASRMHMDFKCVKYQSNYIMYYTSKWNWKINVPTHLELNAMSPNITVTTTHQCVPIHLELNARSPEVMHPDNDVKNVMIINQIWIHVRLWAQLNPLPPLSRDFRWRIPHERVYIQLSEHACYN